MIDLVSIVYIARHATPDWTRSDLSYYLPPGPPLTEKGKAEAEALGGFFVQAGIRSVFTSPIERCFHTAQIAAQTAGIEMETIHALTEWQPGENMEGVARRLWPAFERARLLGAKGKPAVLVTHGGPVAALLDRLGMDADTLLSHRIYDHSNPLPPAGVWQARQCGAGRPWELKLVFKPE